MSRRSGSRWGYPLRAVSESHLEGEWRKDRWSLGCRWVRRMKSGHGSGSPGEGAVGDGSLRVEFGVLRKGFTRDLALLNVAGQRAEREANLLQ